jgi:hypothetical protein
LQGGQAAALQRLVREEFAFMSTNPSGDSTPFTAPVWWDPKNRKIGFDAMKYVPGVLVVDHAYFRIWTPGGVAAEGSLAGASVGWPSFHKRLGMPVSELRLANGAVCKIFFSLPNTYAPKHSKKGIEKIAAAMKVGGSTVEVAGNNLLDGASYLSDTAQLTHIAGQAIQAVVVLGDLKRGRERHRQFLQLLTSI